MLPFERRKANGRDAWDRIADDLRVLPRADGYLIVEVGVYTFYPSPEGPFRDRVLSLNRQEQAIRNSEAPHALTPEDRAKIQRLTGGK